jgi:hypothetical protein
MNNRDARRIDQLERIVRFLDNHAHTLGAELNARRRQFHTFLSDADRLRQTLLQRHHAAAAHAAGIRALLRTKHMLPLARYAKPAFPDEPRVLQHLRVPHKSANANTILSAARGMLEALRPYRDYLEQCDVDVTRLDRLEQAIDEHDRTSQIAVDTSGDHAIATRELRTILARAYAGIIGIDAAMRADHPALLGQWQLALRMHKRIGRPKKRRVAASIE